MWLIPPKGEEAKRGLLLIGKLLFLCNKFEDTCKSIVMWVRLSKNLEDAKFEFMSKNHLSFVDILLGPKTTLGNSIEEFKEEVKDKSQKETREGFLYGFANKGEIDILNKARKARNYICHKGYQLFSYKYPNEDFRLEKRDINQKLHDLIEGEYLVSKWMYEFSEKESGDFFSRADYNKKLKKWFWE